MQDPVTTLRLKRGSCRDFAVLMMEAARYWGFGARFVTGYIQMGEGQHGATHAWTEIYIPGAGWHGFDPTNNKLAGSEHISVAVAREHDNHCRREARDEREPRLRFHLRRHRQIQQHDVRPAGDPHR